MSCNSHEMRPLSHLVPTHERIKFHVDVVATETINVISKGGRVRGGCLTQKGAARRVKLTLFNAFRQQGRAWNLMYEVCALPIVFVSYGLVKNKAVYFII